jgi:hypothetical protein
VRGWQMLAWQPQARQTCPIGHYSKTIFPSAELTGPTDPQRATGNQHSELQAGPRRISARYYTGSLSDAIRLKPDDPCTPISTSMGFSTDSSTALRGETRLCRPLFVLTYIIDAPVVWVRFAEGDIASQPHAAPAMV